MELRHPSYFTAVAENLHFAEASRWIHVAQPASGCGQHSAFVIIVEEQAGHELGG